MAIGPEIIDRYLAYRSFLLRYENQVVRDILGLMLEAEERATGAIVSAYEAALKRAGGELLTPWDGYGVGFRRKALRRSRAALADVFPEARKSLKTALTGLAQDGQELFLETIEEGLPRPVVNELQLSRVPERQLARIVASEFNERAAVKAILDGDEFKELGDTALKRLNKTIAEGVRDGDGLRQMAARARRTLGVEGSLGRDVSSYVRTSVQATANDVAAEMHRENADIVRGEQYHATLDADTCPICGPLDGRVEKLEGKNKLPRPPRHPNCRCFITPVLKNWREMGLPESIPQTLKQRFNGRAGERTVWADWILKKPGRVEAILGPGRADLVKQGVPLKKLFADTSYGLVPLDKLRPKAKGAA